MDYHRWVVVDEDAGPKRLVNLVAEVAEDAAAEDVVVSKTNINNNRNKAVIGKCKTS